MKLLDYLEPMKNMPNRFSNLAFWRSVRYLKDVVVDAFTYVNSWGTGIEAEQAKQNEDIEKLESELEVTNGKVKENTDNITQLGNDLEVANGKIKSNSDSITGLANDLQVAEGNIQTNSNNIVKLVSDLADTNTKVAANTASISTLDGKVKEITVETGKIDSIESELNSTVERVSECESRIEADTADISQIKQDLATTNENVTAATETANSASTVVGDLSKLVYNQSSTDYVMLSEGQYFTVTDCGNGLFTVTPTSMFVDLPSLPHHIAVIVTLPIYTNSDKSATNTTCYIVPYHTTCLANKTRVIINITSIYAPYGTVSTKANGFIYYIAHK